jgi:hypothetical protein
MTPDNGDESEHRALNVLLDQIAHSEGKETFDELGGRTPTQAWLAGDEKAVEQLVRGWYLETKRNLDAMRRDPRVMQMIRDKIAALDAKSGLPSAS